MVFYNERAKPVVGRGNLPRRDLIKTGVKGRYLKVLVAPPVAGVARQFWRSATAVGKKVPPGKRTESILKCKNPFYNVMG